MHEQHAWNCMLDHKNLQSEALISFTHCMKESFEQLKLLRSQEGPHLEKQLQNSHFQADLLTNQHLLKHLQVPAMRLKLERYRGIWIGSETLLCYPEALGQGDN